MSITTYTDETTRALLDDAIEQLATARGLNLARDTTLLSIIGSHARQLEQMTETAIAESDIGHSITINDIAGLLDISTAEANNRYNPTNQQ